jgi:hypothetical protein
MLFAGQTARRRAWRVNNARAVRGPERGRQTDERTQRDQRQKWDHAASHADASNDRRASKAPCAEQPFSPSLSERWVGTSSKHCSMALWRSWRSMAQHTHGGSHGGSGSKGRTMRRQRAPTVCSRETGAAQWRERDDGEQRQKGRKEAPGHTKTARNPSSHQSKLDATVGLAHSG